MSICLLLTRPTALIILSISFIFLFYKLYKKYNINLNLIIALILATTFFVLTFVLAHPGKLVGIYKWHTSGCVLELNFRLMFL